MAQYTDIFLVQSHVTCYKLQNTFAQNANIISCKCIICICAYFRYKLAFMT